MSRFHELRPDELELVSGGGTTKLFAEVHPGIDPSHSYGLLSDTFQAPNYQAANTLLQQFNAPTHDALYGQGNDPSMTAGTVVRPGAQDLHGSSLFGIPLDSGGNVTLQHGDGYAVNTTVAGQHPLEGTISRNLVTDFHDGGGYQVLTLGQGHGGAELATAIGAGIGAVVGAVVGGKGGAILGGAGGGAGAQNTSHLLNPELGATAFSELDNALLSHADGTHNPNLDLPSGRGVELGYSADAAKVGVESALGHTPPTHFDDAQTETLAALGHDLNSQGPVTGSFARSSNDVGIYHFTPDGSKYYEMDNGHVVEKQVDEMSGVDHAIAHQTELNAQHPQATPDGEIHLPDPPAQINELPLELTPHDGNTPSGPDHTENVSSPTQFAADTGHTNDTAITVDPGNHTVDTGNHGTDVVVASLDTPVAPVVTAPVAPVDIPPVTPVDIPPVIPVDTAPVMPIDIPPVIPVFDIPSVIPPIQIPTFDPPPVIAPIQIPVVAPVDPGIDTSIAGIGINDVGGGTYMGGGNYGGSYGGSFDMAGDFGGGFDGGGFGGSFDV